MINDLKYSQVFENTTIKTCFLFLEKSTKQIIFVIDKKKKLLGSITDGDLRRAILKNSRLDQKINNIYVLHQYLICRIMNIMIIYIIIIIY